MEDYRSDAAGVPAGDAAVERATHAAVERARRKAGWTRHAFLARSASGALALTGLGALLEACGGGGTNATTSAGPVGSPPARPTGRLRVAIANYPDTFDPTIVGSLAELTYAPAVFESLVQFDDKYTKLVPALATKWSANEDATEWTFALRDGVTFHDGTAFDAAAAERSLQYMTRKAAPYGFLFGAPKISAPDEKTIVLRYDKPFPDLTHNLTYCGAFMSPKLLTGSLDAAAKRVAKQHIGTGPFRFAGTRAGQSVTLQPFDKYWGKQSAHIATLELVVISDESARVSALQAGDVDLVLQVAPLAARSLKTNPKLSVKEANTWTTVCLMPLADRAPFDDVRVRQAVAHAVDRPALVKSVLLGEAVVADSMFPPGIPGYHKPSTTYPHDPAKARALLKAAGYAGQRLRMATRSDAVLASEITQALVAQLKDVGFNITGEVLDAPVYEADAAKPKPKYDVHWNEYGWVTGGPFHFTLGTIAGRAHYANKKYTDIVAKVNATPDGPERNQLIANAIDQWAADAGWVVLWVPKRIDASVSDLQAYHAPANVYTLFGGTYRSAAS